jgi:small subunit ribosomal protein S21
VRHAGFRTRQRHQLRPAGAQEKDAEEGTFGDLKRRRAYEKSSERRVREKAEAMRRHRKMLRKWLEREGY